MTTATIQRFYALLDRTGMSGGNQHPVDAERTLARIRELGDYPDEYWEPLEQTVLGNGVTNIDTVLKYMEASKARGIAPGSRPRDEKPVAVYDDAFIVKHVAANLERACECDEARCVEYRELLGKVLA